MDLCHDQLADGAPDPHTHFRRSVESQSVLIEPAFSFSGAKVALECLVITGRNSPPSGWRMGVLTCVKLDFDAQRKKLQGAACGTSV